MLFTVVFLTCHLSHSLPAQSQTHFSEAIWESPRIKQALISIGWGDVDGDGQKQWVFLKKNQLVVNDAGLRPLIKRNATASESFHRLQVGDWDGDGRDDILLSGFRNGQIFTEWLQFQGRKQKLKKRQSWGLAVVAMQTWQTPESSPYWPQPKEDDSENKKIKKKKEDVEPKPIKRLSWQLWSQSHRGRWAWSNEVIRWEWDGTKFVKGQKLKWSGGVGKNKAALWHLIRGQNHWGALSLTGNLSVHKANGKKVWRSGMRYGGALDWVEYQGKSSLLGVEQQDRFPVQPRMLYHPYHRELIVIKNEGFVGNVVGKFPNMKAVQLVHLQWVGDLLRESSSSPRIDGAITDMSLIDYDGDGWINELAVVLWLRKNSVLGTDNQRQAIIGVIRLPQEPRNNKRLSAGIPF